MANSRDGRGRYLSNGGTDGPNEWAAPGAQRDLDGVVGHGDRDPRLAVGYDIDAKNAFGHTSMDGKMDQAQLNRGWRYNNMSPTEPMYTGEPYYDIAKIRREKLDYKNMDFYNTDEGFVERFNYMDRL